MKTPKLFEKQPALNKAEFERLTNAGLIVPQTVTRKLHGVENQAPLQFAGDVVCYPHLCKALKARKVSQDDARRLLAIEAIRPNGHPRQSHIARLIVVAFQDEKNQALAKLEEAAKAIHKP